MSSSENRRRRDRARRAKLRARLESQGANQQLIEKAIEAQRREDLIARHGPEKARKIIAWQIAQHQDPQPDDTNYQPNPGDPLLRGPARATGITAKIVKRTNTITRYQYEHLKKTGGPT